MTPEQIKSALADAIEAAIDGVHDMDVTHTDYARAAAAAIYELVKPLPLVWVKHPTNDIWRCDKPTGTYKVFAIGASPSWDFDGSVEQFSHVVKNVPIAFSAAHSHADAAHWADTALADMIGGK